MDVASIILPPIVKDGSDPAELSFAVYYFHRSKEHQVQCTQYSSLGLSVLQCRTLTTKMSE